MKICFLSYHSCPYSLLGSEGTGGMNVYLRELSRALNSYSGAKIDILTRKQKPGIKKIKKIAPGIRLIHLQSGPELPVDRRSLLKYIPKFTEEAEIFIKTEGLRYDVIHSHYWLSGLVGEKLKRKFGGLMFHSYHTLALLKEDTFQESEHPSRIRVEKKLALSSDGIVCNCREEKEVLEKCLAITLSKAKVIYPGVNGQLFQPVKDKALMNKKKAGEVWFLYVGRIEPDKGLRTVVEAFSRLKQNYPEKFRLIKLLVVGGGKVNGELQRNPEVKSLKRLVEKEGLVNNMFFLGSKKQVELKRYYSVADALVVPSYYESFGLVAVEALACGTPVIASCTGGLKCILRPGKNGFYFSPGNPESLSEILISFPGKREKLWKPELIRQDTLERFNWRKTAAEILSFYLAFMNEEEKFKIEALLDEMLLPA